MSSDPDLWVPTFQEVLGAALNLARRNLWRVRPLYDMEDLMGEAYVVFARCVRKYPRVVDPPHFMALFLSAWARTLHSMASRRTRSASGHTVPGSEVRDDGSVYDPMDQAAVTVPRWKEEERFLERVEAAPPAVRALIEGLDRVGRPRKCGARRAGGTRETTNAFLCRIAQVPDTVDLRGELNAFLEHGSV